MEYIKLSPDVSKKVVSVGLNGEQIFKDGSKITFHFETCSLNENGEILKSIDISKNVGRPMELILGKQFKMSVWEMALKSMKIGEISEFIVKKNLVDAYPLVSKGYREFAGVSKPKKGHCCGMMAYTEGIGHSDLDDLIRTPRDLMFRFELIKVQQSGEYEKEAWTMNPEEKLQTIPALKEAGNVLYKEQQYEEAAKKYYEALGLLEQLLLREKPGEEEFLDLENLKTPILLNYAQCKLLQKEYYAVIEHTSEILNKDNKNLKALYRRAKAYVGTWDLELAQQDFIRLAEIDPSLKVTVQKELNNINVLQKQKDEDIKSKLFGKVFGDNSQS